MTSVSASIQAMPSPLALRDRCHAMGVAMWRFASNGKSLAAPIEVGPVGDWLKSPFIQRLVSDSAVSWGYSNELSPRQVFPGCWLIPLEERRRRRRLSLSVAMALTPEALDSEQFLSACSSAGLDARVVGDKLRGMARFSQSGIEQFASMLRLMNEDLSSISAQSLNIESLSRQLTESYEEMSLLYRLREYMSELAQPQRFVRQACFELHEVLPFRWIGARFVDDQRHARTLAGRSFTSGELTCTPESFERAALAVLLTLEPGSSRVMSGEDAAAFGVEHAQVLAHPITLAGAVIGAIFAGEKYSEDIEVTNIELKMVEAASGYVAILAENAGLYEDERSMFLGLLRALTASIDAKDPYTCGHSERVAELSADLARAVGMSEAQVERVRIAGLVHDIGKIGVPEAVLRKPGRLTEEEFGMMKLHPEIGYRILRDIPQLEDVLPGVLHHHERFDGRGYPAGLSGDRTPLMARIISLADSFDAMSSTRTYRSAMDRQRVLGEIEKCAGTQFDPQLAQLFLGLDLTEYDEMVARHQAQTESGGGITGVAA